MISVIIPALSEAKALPGTLDALFRQRGDFEVIVVDGGSDDSTMDIARADARVKVVSAPRGRALQMNAGATHARGNLLLFLHADTRLPSGSLRLLDEAAADRNAQFGGFMQRFSGSHWGLRLISQLHNWRCKQTGIFYGDQAIFVSRSLFNTVGGFPEWDILEDVALSEKLLEHAKPFLVNRHVVTDSRKFEQMGVWRSLMRCTLILACYELRLPIIGTRFFQPVR